MYNTLQLKVKNRIIINELIDLIFVFLKQKKFINYSREIKFKGVGYDW